MNNGLYGEDDDDDDNRDILSQNAGGKECCFQ